MTFQVANVTFVLDMWFSNPPNVERDVWDYVSDPPNVERDVWDDVSDPPNVERDVWDDVSDDVWNHVLTDVLGDV